MTFMTADESVLASSADKVMFLVTDVTNVDMGVFKVGRCSVHFGI